MFYPPVELFTTVRRAKQSTGVMLPGICLGPAHRRGRVNSANLLIPMIFSRSLFLDFSNSKYLGNYRYLAMQRFVAFLFFRFNGQHALLYFENHFIGKPDQNLPDARKEQLSTFREPPPK